jgi:C4-dicarboxylate-specific signal transduction histidine kinase
MKSNPHDKSYFMGRVTASVSHELQNVLAIIRETAGLMQDFMMMGDRCENLAERLETSLASIKNQVNRGVALTHGLNGFAHSADNLTCTIDIRGTLTRLLHLTERITRNKGFTVGLMAGEAPAPIFDPVVFQSLCLLCLDALAQSLPANRALTVTPAETKGKAALTFQCPVPGTDALPEITSFDHWSSLSETCAGHRVTLSLTEGTPGIRLVFP